MNLRIAKLKRSSDFKLITNTGFKSYTAGFLLFCLPNDSDLETIKVGFTASKRVGCAVKRNRCKRLMRALSVEVLQKNIYVSANCVMIARPQLLVTPYQQLKADTMFCAKRFMRSVESSKYE